MSIIGLKKLKSEEIYECLSELKKELGSRPNINYFTFATSCKYEGEYIILDAIIKEDGNNFVRVNLSHENWINKIVLKIFNGHIKKSSKFKTIEQFRDAFINYRMSLAEVEEMPMTDRCPYFNIDKENESEDNKNVTYKAWIYNKNTNKIFSVKDEGKFWKD